MSNVSKKLKVLIGDDSEEYGVKCAQELREMGFFCIVRPKDGGVILEAVTSEVPDVVVADLWMPGLDAIELMKKVNKSSKSKPAFIITAPLRKRICAAAGNAGGCGLLSCKAV